MNNTRRLLPGHIVIPQLILLLSALNSSSAISSTFYPDVGRGPDANVEKILASLDSNQEYVQIGDMVFLVDQLERSGFIGPRWTNGEVFYEFDVGLNEVQRVQWLAAAKSWSEVADLHFIERSTQQNYIRIFTDSGNWSSAVGMAGGEQRMGIGDWSSPYIIGIIAHEIGHALGLGHEHTRPDRDLYVLVNTVNIQDQFESQYSIWDNMETHGEYDYESVMHYDPCAFSVDCPSGHTCECVNLTMAAQPPYEDQQEVMGQRTHLSTLDAQGMNIRYNNARILVSNVQVAQRSLSGLVDVTYDLETVGDEPVWVSLFLSSDSGESYPHLCLAVSGDVGATVLPGLSRHIVWDAGIDFPGYINSTCKLRVTADDGGNMQDFTYIVPGVYIMGSPMNEPGRESDETQHQVTLTHGFYVQTTEVTNQQYMEMAQWAFDNGFATATSNYLSDNLDGSTQILKRLGSGSYEISFSDGVFSCTNPDHPVKFVTWYGSVAYCDWLSLREGLSRAYSHATWLCNGGDPYTADGYRLPTEVEWEYACRSGSVTAFSSGSIVNLNCNIDPNLELMGWYCGNAGGWTHPVGQKLSNGYTLYDMHGNLCEWCNDWYGAYGGDAINPVGPGTGSERVRRGGYWAHYSQNCRSADRGSNRPTVAENAFGFRPVKSAH